jgi:hypothetical protein
MSKSTLEQRVQDLEDMLDVARRELREYNNPPGPAPTSASW